MHFINSKIFTALIMVLFVWILFSVIYLEIEKSNVKKEEKNTEERIKGVKHNNELLGKFIKYSSNPSFLEKEARLRLNYKALDEEVVFVHRDSGSKKASSADEFSEYRLSSFKKWLRYFIVY